MTYPITNSSDRTSHTEVAITQPGVIQYTVYVGRVVILHDIMIFADDNTEMKSANFSKQSLVDVVCCVVFNLLILWLHNVQDCDVSTDHTSILVECTFAINSTAPGIVVIQDDQSQYTINKTLQRLQQLG